LKRQGKLSEAIDAGEKAVSLWEKMVAAFNYQGHRSMLAGSLDLLGDLLVQDKQYQAAEKCYKKAFPIWQQLVAEFNLPEYWTRLVLNREHLGHLLKESDRLHEAERAYREAVAVWQKLVTDFHEEEHRLHLCDVRATLAENLLAQGKHADAAKVAEEVPATSPHEVSQYHRAADLLARCVSAAEKDAKRTAVERKRMAQAYDRRSRELRREAATRSPDSPRTQNLSAWFLATCADLRFRDPVRAIELAQKAVKGSPKSAGYWNTLGVARYRAGQYHEAIAALEESIELEQDVSIWNRFFLAMSHWQFGNKPEARKWYDAAVNQMEKSEPNEELSRFRAEAAERLGIKETKH
jgi:tetratricopeptide (TPR) repeat protein